MNTLIKTPPVVRVLNKRGGIRGCRVVYNSFMTPAIRHIMPVMVVPRTTEEDHENVPFPPDARPVRKRTIPATKRIRPIQSNVFTICETVVRFVGLSLRKITSTAIAKPPVLNRQV